MTRKLTRRDFARRAAPLAHYWVEYRQGLRNPAWIRVPDICRSAYRAGLVRDALEKRLDCSTRIVEVRIP
jgi:hypothetical protein